MQPHAWKLNETKNPRHLFESMMIVASSMGYCQHLRSETIANSFLRQEPDNKSSNRNLHRDLPRYDRTNSVSLLFRK